MGDLEKGLESLLELVNSIDLERAVEEKQAEMTPMDRLVEELRKGGTVVRKKKRPKMHYKVRRRKRREYYARVEAPRRKKRLAAQLAQGPQGWYKFLRKQWQQQSIKVPLTLEEFETILWPAIEGYVFTVRRYDTKGPIRLDNIWVEDCESRKVLWDGKEHRLRELGMIV